MEKFKRLLIETPIDRLVTLAQKKKGITTKTAASILGTSERQVEDWVRILEEHSMLKLVFPPVGRPRIFPMKIPPGAIIRRVEEFERRGGEVELLAERYEERVGEAEKRFTGKFVTIEDDLLKKLRDVEKNLRALAALKVIRERLEADISKFERTKTRIIGEAKRIEDVSARTAEHMGLTRDSVKDLEKEINKNIEELETHENEIKILDTEKKRVEDEILALNKEIKIVESLAPKIVPKETKASFVKMISRILKAEKGKKRLRKKKERVHKKIKKIKKKIEKIKR